VTVSMLLINRVVSIYRTAGQGKA